MGFTIPALHLCNKISPYLHSSSVLSFGNPFLHDDVLAAAGIGRKLQRALKKVRREDRAKFLFEEIYGATQFSVLDISDEEGADILWNLNNPIDKEMSSPKYDYLLDFGTQEHVFDNCTFLENVFSFLKPGGFYIFLLPANCDLEHGFRQYSPTFFYDFCVGNSHLACIEHLALCKKEYSLNVLPLYSRMDLSFSSAIGANTSTFEGLSSDNHYLTGVSISLLNQMKTPISLLGVISKRKEGNLNFNISQCLYRNNSLGQIIPESKSLLIDRQSFLSSLKIFVLNFPFPASFKLIVLNFLARCIRG